MDSWTNNAYNANNAYFGELLYTIQECFAMKSSGDHAQCSGTSTALVKH